MACTARTVEAATATGGGATLTTLVEQLARQSKALANSDSFLQVPARQLEASTLPPLPKPATDAEGRASLGNIFPRRNNRAVVEAFNELESKPLLLDEAEGQAARPAPEAPPPAVVAPAPARLETVEEAADVLDELPTPSFDPAPVERDSRPAAGSGPMVLPELTAPPERPMGNSMAQGQSGSGVGVAVGVIVALAAVAAGAYFFFAH